MDQLLNGINASSTAMRGERLRLQTAAQNIAMSRATRTPEGGPYRRREVVFKSILDAAGNPRGVEASVVVDQGPLPTTHDPQHPDADADGKVAWPNVELTHEMVDLQVSRRSYEANAVAFETLMGSLQRSIDLGRSGA